MGCGSSKDVKGKGEKGDKKGKDGKPARKKSPPPTAPPPAKEGEAPEKLNAIPSGVTQEQSESKLPGIADSNESANKEPKKDEDGAEESMKQDNNNNAEKPEKTASDDEDNLSGQLKQE